jgi:hypothetical protein
MTDDLRSDLEPHDAGDLLPLASRLHARRPVPRASFRGELRRRLVADPVRLPARPRRLWLLAGTSFASGTLLLAVVALGVGGSGPFAA